MWNRYFAVAGALLAALGVLLGAYHAHGLMKWLVASGVGPEEVVRRLHNADVAIRYQLYHALALLVLGSLRLPRPSRWLTASCWMLCSGLLLFSGGLYLIVFTGQAIHWAIVPLGGVLLIVAWGIVAVALWKTSGDRAEI